VAPSVNQYEQVSVNPQLVNWINEFMVGTRNSAGGIISIVSIIVIVLMLFTSVEEVFNVINQTLLLISTMALLPQNLVDVAQNMAGQMSAAISPTGEIDQNAMSGILAQAMTAAGVYKQPIAQMDEPTAREKLAQARRNLI
jgi:hypothetical protein